MNEWSIHQGQLLYYMPGKQHGTTGRPLDLQAYSSGFQSTFCPPFPLLKNGTHDVHLSWRLQWLNLLVQCLAQHQGTAGAEWVLIAFSFCAFWTVLLPEDWARLGRCWRREGWLFLLCCRSLDLVEEAGCAYTKSSISFPAPHLELGPGKHPLQQQLVHLTATAPTHGECRKERRRGFSSLSTKRVKPHLYYVHWRIGLATDVFLL